MVKETKTSGKEMKTSGSRKIVIKQPDLPQRKEQLRKRRETMVFVGEEEENPQVIVIGDSNMRNVGKNLVTQSKKYVAISRSGARIEDVNELLEEEAGKDAETCVVELGSNNLLVEEKDTIIERYKKLIEDLKQRRKRIIMLGILPRKDASRFIDIKRMEINMILQGLCRTEGIEFLDVEFSANRLGYLAKDGLHLNWSGADMVARKIFHTVRYSCKCCKSLN
jgi:prefoldin subunit 5